MTPAHHHSESYFAEAHRLNNDEVAPAFLIALHHNESGILHPLPTETAVGRGAPVAMVELHHGHWIVRCPFDGCDSAQHASFTDHRFFCAYCRNLAVGHRYVAAKWPKPDEVALIESVVGFRLPENRNWSRGESVAKLRSENREYGLPSK